MRAVVQRVSTASVRVADEVIGAIDLGLVVLLGVGHGDDEVSGAWLANKIANLRIFPDDADRMNRSLIEVGGSALVVSQFTLHGDCRKGRRPSFVGAAPPQLAQPLYARFCEQLLEVGVPKVESGVFGAMMDVALVNDGPVTLIIDTPASGAASGEV
jgi:D-tyrosyl-tRNA(Tyr) deacylase